MPACWPGQGSGTHRSRLGAPENHAKTLWAAQGMQAILGKKTLVWAQWLGAAGSGVWGRKGSCFRAGLVTLEFLHLLPGSPLNTKALLARQTHAPALPRLADLPGVVPASFTSQLGHLRVLDLGLGT